VAKRKGLALLGPTFIQRSRSLPSEQKAIYHNVTGAGRSQVIRKFMGLTDQNKADLREAMERVIAERIAKAGG
jgi:hypothetical protein